MFPDATQWLCGACGRWNKIENQVCTGCRHSDREHAFSFRVNRQLNPEEKMFYEHSVPAIIAELKQQNKTLTRMLEVLHERQGTDEGISEAGKAD